MSNYITPADTSNAAKAYAEKHGLDSAAAAQYELGLLTCALRKAKDELRRFTGDGAKPQADCRFHDVTWGDAEVKLEYEFTDGEPQSWNGLTGIGHPGSPASVSILQMLVNGVWIDPDGLVHPDLIDRWETEIAEAREDSERAAIEEYYDARRDERRAA